MLRFMNLRYKLLNVIPQAHLNPKSSNTVGASGDSDSDFGPDSLMDLTNWPNQDESWSTGDAGEMKPNMLYGSKGL
ncbi:hypothetical protein GOBAR_AA37957 [Gossypium barbadense]|uniref:Uncharacterized protein n=1 Tax=Gossypium barbadense TaxID=3634 RepID=A0A2P5VV96_GOSBA|nr:hypothetical protein GOBAR_AA37957 [Gossypium barbadense]